MNHLRIKRQIEVPSMNVWSQTAHFSYLHVERNQEQDEESFKFVPGSWNKVKERRKWKETFWATAQDENEARKLIETYFKQKVEESQKLREFTSSLKKDFQLTERKALGIRPTIHSKLISSNTKVIS